MLYGKVIHTHTYVYIYLRRRLLRVPWTARRSNESILKEIKRQSLTFIGRTDAEAETPIIWPPDVKN